MSTRTYLSIGDVLSLLRQEFPDITISKIRFLESQGLVDPERSPSGYRKFYEHDVERLRWVLRQQREHFLPLKVIRDRLETDGGETAEHDAVAGVDDVPEEPGEQGAQSEPDAAANGAAPEKRPSRRDADERPAAWRREPDGPARQPLASARREGAGAASLTRPGTAEAASNRPSFDLRPETSGSPSPSGSDPGRPSRAGQGGANVTGASLTLQELCAASGLAANDVAALEGFGLIEPLVVGGALYYDEEALTVAKLVADFARFGIQPRHLRLFRNAVDRELGLVEQVVTPLLRQRNPEARQRALEAAAELSRLGQALCSSLLRRALRHHLGG